MDDTIGIDKLISTDFYSTHFPSKGSNKKCCLSLILVTVENSMVFFFMQQSLDFLNVIVDSLYKA